MGCDIHLFTERKRSVNSKEKWVNIDNWKLNHYYEEADEEENESKYEISSAYTGRNYSLFSMLADVRNSDDNKIISNPKGLPKDVSEVVKEVSKSWGEDGHSHSFLIMGELYDYYEKNKIVKFSGMVDDVGVKQIDAGEMPGWWCASSSNKSLIYKEWEHPNLIIKNFIETLETHFKSEYYEKSVDSEKFRIVFWFDN